MQYNFAKPTKYITLSLWDVLPHQVYLQDIVPSDFHLFRLLQHTQFGQHLKKVDDIRNSTY